MNNDKRNSNSEANRSSERPLSEAVYAAPAERLVSSPYSQVTSEYSPGPIVSLQPDDTIVAHTPLPPIPVAAPEAINSDEPTVDLSLNQPVRWQATEFIHHEKNTTWLVIFSVIVVGFIAFALLVLDSKTFAFLIPVMAVALLVYTYRQPRVLDYALSRKGLYVNDRLYSFKEFKGFGVIKGAEVGDEYSIMLIPTHRFKPGVYVYFPQKAGEAIVDMLAARLPMQDLHLDIIDRVIKKLRL